MPVKTFLAGGGEAGALIRSFDWTTTPLGPPESWPEALRTGLAVCLNSAMASALYWGPDFTTFYNDAWAQQRAGRHPWAMGRPARDSRAEMWATLQPQFEQVRATGRGISVTDQHLPMQRDGESDSWWSYSLIPLYEPDGTVGGLLTQGFETTAQIRARQVLDQQTSRLRESEERFRLVAESAPVMLWMGDAHGKCLYLNRAQREFWGVTDETFASFDWNNTVHPEDVAVLAEPFMKGMSEQARFTVEARYFRADGKVRTLQTNAEPRFGPDGEFLGMIGVNADVTDVREAQSALARSRDELEAAVKERTDKLMSAESQLRQAQKMEAIGQLTGGIAHDFNNMLAVVMSGLNLLQRKLAKGETDVGRYIDGSMEGARRAAALTSRLLAFSRQQQLAPEQLDANRLVQGMTDLLSRTLGEAIRVETVLSAGLWQTLADANQLESAILNLAVNARDAMEDGGKLTIETANAHIDDAYASEYAVAAGQYVMIAVTDTGEGMTPEVMAKAFDPFFTTKDVGKGTGLGLSQVFGFIRQSGGHVKIYSEPGLGTTVKIYLPRSHVQTAAGDRKRADGDVSSGTGEVVMVVEDEERVRANSVEALKELGYTVIEARSPGDALRMIESGMPMALLFTDVVMPEMNGRQLAERATRLRPGLKVLYTTGYTGNAALSNGLLDPGTLHVSKPFTIDQLALKVRQALDS